MALEYFGSSSGAPIAIDESTILALTASGERQLREAGTALDSALLEALILIDGQTSISQLGLQSGSAAQDGPFPIADEVIRRNLAIPLDRSDNNSLDPGDFFSRAPRHASRVTPLSGNLKKATRSAQILQQKGYYVNLARRPICKRTFLEDRKLSLLVIDDDPDICNLLKMYMTLENFETRTAANRSEILASLSARPLPDLILLDLCLTDVNGFDVLAAVRRHTTLKTIPVIIMTASATREAVLKGVKFGADGYVTKPFQIHPLVGAVKTVLGMPIERSATEIWGEQYVR